MVVVSCVLLLLAHSVQRAFAKVKLQSTCKGYKGTGEGLKILVKDGVDTAVPAYCTSDGKERSVSYKQIFNSLPNTTNSFLVG